MSEYPPCDIIAFNRAIQYALEMAKATGQPYKITIEHGRVDAVPMAQPGKAYLIASPNGSLENAS